MSNGNQSSATPSYEQELNRKCGPKITLAVRHMGHVPSFKNNKRSIRLKNGSSMPVTDKKTKKWMQKCIESFESQLFCDTLITGVGTLTGPFLPSLIAWYLPQDDSRQWIPELHIYAEQVKPGEEGAKIIIERL